jgi:hypothetical protein
MKNNGLFNIKHLNNITTQIQFGHSKLAKVNVAHWFGCAGGRKFRRRVF